MRAHELELTELVDHSEGHLSLKGRRLVLHAIHAMAYLRGELARAIGIDKALFGECIWNAVLVNGDCADVRLAIGVSQALDDSDLTKP